MLMQSGDRTVPGGIRFYWVGTTEAVYAAPSTEELVMAFGAEGWFSEAVRLGEILEIPPEAELLVTGVEDSDLWLRLDALPLEGTQPRELWRAGP